MIYFFLFETLDDLQRRERARLPLLLLNMPASIIRTFRLLSEDLRLGNYHVVRMLNMGAELTQKHN